MTDVPDVACDTRTVKPRNHEASHYEVIALSNGEGLLEDGTSTVESAIIRTLHNRPASIFVARNVAEFIARADTEYSDHERWNWKASASEREIVHPNGTRFAARVGVVIHWFGFRGVNPQLRGVQHLALDPITFYGRRLDDICPGPEPAIIRLMQWATQLRDWCNANDLWVRPTAGAVGAQLLRDRRFYPHPRRKVPAAINRRARDALPGNYYRLYGRDTDRREFQAIYLDQQRAHHYHARNLRFPHADSLTARGNYLALDGDPDITIGDPWVTTFCGLYYAVFDTPMAGSQWGPFPDTPPNETVSAFVFTNEVPILTDLGYRFHGAIAAWGSHKQDTGLRRYATWADDELTLYGAPRWLKPILLSTYGVLATRPKPIRYLYHHAKHGEPTHLHVGHSQLHGLLVGNTHGRKVEPGFANVLHRGMIEAATRADSLGMAYDLHQQGFNILSIYADAVLVEDEGQTLPPLLPPWREQERLTHLQFINTQAFVSAQLDKLPGVIGREILKGSRGVVGGAPKHAVYNTQAVTGDKIVTGKRRYLSAG